MPGSRRHACGRWPRERPHDHAISCHGLLTWPRIFRSTAPRPLRRAGEALPARAQARDRQSEPFHLHRHLLLRRGPGPCRRDRSGPGRDGEAEALLQALGVEQVAHIIVTHTHRDHSPGARRLQALTGAKIAGCAPHWSARATAIGEASPLDASATATMHPTCDGRRGCARGRRLAARSHRNAGPYDEPSLLRPAAGGDIVLRRPCHGLVDLDRRPARRLDGRYMGSLERLRGRSERIYRPGHGGPVTDPDRFLRGSSATAACARPRSSWP